jgi:hypothetical protein
MSARLASLAFAGLLAPGVLAASSLAPQARLAAEEPPAPSAAQALVAGLEAARTAKDFSAWSGHLGKVGEVWKDANEADKKVLAGAVGQALKAKDEGVQLAAVKAFVATGDGEAAWKGGLKSAMPDVKAEAAELYEVRAVEALKELRPDAAIPTLLGLVAKGKDPKVAAAAVKALGGYERSAKRVQILTELVGTLRTARPGTNPQTGQRGSSPRWDAMEPEAVPALNELTGQKLGDFDAWLQLFDENKKKPAALFMSPLD